MDREWEFNLDNEYEPFSVDHILAEYQQEEESQAQREREERFLTLTPDLSVVYEDENILIADKKPGVPKGASGQLGEAELEAIQRVLREG